MYTKVIKVSKICELVNFLDGYLTGHRTYGSTKSIPCLSQLQVFYN